MLMGTKNNSWREGLLKLSKAISNVVPEEKLANLSTLIFNGESWSIPSAYPLQMGVWLLPEIVLKSPERKHGI